MRRLSSADNGSETRFITLQIWTAWEVVIEGTTGKVTVRFRFGGQDQLSDGKIEGESNWRTHTHDASGCDGDVASGRVVVHLESGKDMQLRFDGAGALIEVIDVDARTEASHGYIRMRTTSSSDREGPDGLLQKWDARNASQACPAALAPPATTSTRGTSSGVKGAQANALPGSERQVGSERQGEDELFEAARSQPGKQLRQTDTGGQSGAGGGREVFFQLLGDVRSACDDGLAEGCRATGIMLRHEGRTAEALSYLERACAGGSKTACKQAGKKR